MGNALRLAAVLLILTTACLAQGQLAVETSGKQKWPADEAQKIYQSACAVVEREFSHYPLRPRVKLVLGADKNSVNFDAREIVLTKWDPYAFAQGIVMLAFEDLMPREQKAAMTRRAMNWADATIDVSQVAK